MSYCQDSQFAEADSADEIAQYCWWQSEPNGLVAPSEQENQGKEGQTHWKSVCV